MEEPNATSSSSSTTVVDSASPSSTKKSKTKNKSESVARVLRSAAKKPPITPLLLDYKLSEEQIKKIKERKCTPFPDTSKFETTLKSVPDEFVYKSGEECSIVSGLFSESENGDTPQKGL